MGGNNTKPVQEDEQPKINHPKFTAPKIIKSGEDQNIIEIKLPIANEKQYNQWVNKLKSMPEDKQPFLLPISHQFKKQGMCGSSGFVTIQYEAFPFLLADQINNRESMKQKFFDEPELWYLVYTLITAGHEFHEKGEKVGDVRPQNVFINQEGQVKVATQYTWPSESTNYHKTFYEKQLTYLSPEQLKDILFAKLESNSDKKLSESFSIGLTCLDAGTLSDSKSLYLKNNKFDYQALQGKLDELQAVKYSDLLISVIRNLCQVDSEKRSTCTQLYRWLKPYEDFIINLQAFEVKNLPQKLLIPRNGSPERTGYQESSMRYSQQNTAQHRSPYNQSENVTYIQNRPTQEYHQTTTFIQPDTSSIPRLQSQPNPTRMLSSPPQPQNQGVVRTTVVNDQVRQQQQGPITSQTFTSSSYTPINGQNQQMRNVTYTQNYTYNQPRNLAEGGSPGREQGRTNMQLTLEKIDEQLQMSRKMFPS